MAAPNIVNVTSIFGKTAYDSDVGTSDSDLLSNAAGSNKVLKINTIIAANIDGTNDADITVFVCTVSGGGTPALYFLAKTTFFIPPLIIAFEHGRQGERVRYIILSFGLL